MNETRPFLTVKVGDTSTIISYVVDGEVVVMHTHPVGYKHIEAEGMNIVAGSKFIDGILYLLEFISLKTEYLQILK